MFEMQLLSIECFVVCFAGGTPPASNSMSSAEFVEAMRGFAYLRVVLAVDSGVVATAASSKRKRVLTWALRAQLSSEFKNCSTVM